MQANEITINVYDDTLANWHALNEKEKKSIAFRGLDPVPLICRKITVVNLEYGKDVFTLYPWFLKRPTDSIPYKSCSCVAQWKNIRPANEWPGVQFRLVLIFVTLSFGAYQFANISSSCKGSHMSHRFGQTNVL